MLKNKSQKNIPDGWSFEQFGDIAKYEQPSKYIVKSTDYKDSGIPVLTAGKSFILGYTHESDGIYKKGDVIIFDDFTTTSQYVNFPFKVKSSAMKLLTAKDGALLKFIFGWMNIRKFKVGEHKRNYLSEYQYQDVLLPSLNEQKRIVAVLEIWDEMVEKLARKIEIKKNIKKGLMQELLSGKKRLGGFSDKWVVVKLGDICDIKTGAKNNQDKIENGKYPFFVRSQNIERINSYSYDGEAILVPGEGNIGKIFHYINGKFDYHQRVYKMSNFKKNAFGKYMHYYLIQNFSRQTKSDSVKATVDSLRLPTFEKFRINLPSAEEQKAIADILVTADKEIEKLEEKLRIIKEQKKFLLNNLITGQIRVPEKAK